MKISLFTGVIFICLMCVICVITIALIMTSTNPNSSLLGDSSSCSVSSLPEVSNNENYTQCHSFDGAFYSSYWYDQSNNWVLGPLSTPQFSQTPEQICFGYCYQGSLPYTCDQDNPEYSACVSQLSPGDCTSPTRPIAKYGNVALYVISIGRTLCL